MLKFLFSLIVLNFSILSIASAQNSYELGKTYTFSSGDVEMTVKLDEEGIATVSRKKVEKYEQPSVIFFGKEGDFKYSDNGTVEFKDEKTASNYWFIPFDDTEQTIHMRKFGNAVTVTCPCKKRMPGITDKAFCEAGLQTDGSGNGTVSCSPSTQCLECGEPKTSGKIEASYGVILCAQNINIK